MSDQLKQFRGQIDHIDDELLKLINQRAALAQQIGHLKDDGLVLRPEREAQVLQRLQNNNAGPLGNQAVAQLFTEVMSQCRALEAPLSVAYLGPQGTFSEAAALKRFGSANTRPILCGDRRCVPCGGKRHGSLWCRACGKLHRRCHRTDA